MTQLDGGAWQYYQRTRPGHRPIRHAEALRSYGNPVPDAAGSNIRE